MLLDTLQRKSVSFNNWVKLSLPVEEISFWKFILKVKYLIQVSNSFLDELFSLIFIIVYSDNTHSNFDEAQLHGKSNVIRKLRNL